MAPSERPSLIAGERDPKVLAQLARVDAIDVDIAAIDTRIGEAIDPFARAVARVGDIPGIGPTTAAVTGTDRARRNHVRQLEPLGY